MSSLTFSAAMALDPGEVEVKHPHNPVAGWVTLGWCAYDWPLRLLRESTFRLRRPRKSRVQEMADDEDLGRAELVAHAIRAVCEFLAQLPPCERTAARIESEFLEPPVKSDAPTAAIVAALRQAGASVVYLSSDTDKGLPDLLVATRKGAYVLFEVKDPSGRADCGCTHTSRGRCEKTLVSMTSTAIGFCSCKGHTGQGNSMRRTRHAQLAWAERHPCMRVVVVHSVLEAVKACGV